MTCCECGAEVPMVGGIEEWAVSRFMPLVLLETPTGRAWCSDKCYTVHNAAHDSCLRREPVEAAEAEARGAGRDGCEDR